MKRIDSVKNGNNNQIKKESKEYERSTAGIAEPLAVKARTGRLRTRGLSWP